MQAQRFSRACLSHLSTAFFVMKRVLIVGDGHSSSPQKSLALADLLQLRSNPFYPWVQKRARRRGTGRYDWRHRRHEGER
jgi:hypothetical protein